MGRTPTLFRIASLVALTPALAASQCIWPSTPPPPASEICASMEASSAQTCDTSPEACVVVLCTNDYAMDLCASGPSPMVLAQPEAVALWEELCLGEPGRAWEFVECPGFDGDTGLRSQDYTAIGCAGLQYR